MVGVQYAADYLISEEGHDYAKELAQVRRLEEEELLGATTLSASLLAASLALSHLLF